MKKLQETLLTINKKIKFGETWWHKTLSASAIRKQVSRCCINFPQELTCQILTNQITKIGCRAWPTRYHGESKVTAFPTSKNWLDFQVRGQFEIKILLGQLISTTYFLCILKKWTWACDHLETCNLSADNLNLVSKSVCISAPKLLFIARKCEKNKHQFPCGADGRSEGVGVRSRDYQIF